MENSKPHFATLLFYLFTLFYCFYTYFTCVLIQIQLDYGQISNKRRINPLSANLTKWSNTLKQFDGKLPTIFLSAFDHFAGLALVVLLESKVILRLLYLHKFSSGKFSRFLRIYGKFGKTYLAEQEKFFIHENLSSKSFLNELIGKNNLSKKYIYFSISSVICYSFFFSSGS